jgi:tryptophan 2,3-dioxygenase
VHRDELLFQVTHQASELWLHLAGEETAEAAVLLRGDRPADATRLVRRTALAVGLCTEQLAMLRHLSPADFAIIRGALGDGSGLQSPGWRALRWQCRALAASFDDCLDQRGVTVASLYQGGSTCPLYDLAEALVDLDEQVTLWRMTHVKIASRILGAETIGTRGTSVEALTALIHQTLFPKLWQARAEIVPGLAAEAVLP